MAINLKSKNEHTKVKLINIVFLQGDDYPAMEREIADSAGWMREADIIDYLLQWYDNDDEHYMSNVYDTEDINTPFLGKLIKIKGYTGYFLFSHNARIGYAGLAKIIEIIHWGA